MRVGGAGSAEKLQGACLEALVSAPASAAGGVWTHAARVEGCDSEGARAGYSGKQGPRGRSDAGSTYPLTLLLRMYLPRSLCAFGTPQCY